MRFKEASLYNTVSVFSSSLFSVIFAIYGMGVWSFIYGQIIGQMFQTFVMAYYSRWMPKIRFNKKHARELLMYGSLITIHDVVSWITSTFDNLVVGKFLGTSFLGIYKVGFDIGSFPAVMIAGSMNKVFYSIFGRLQNDKEELKSFYLKSLKYLSLVMFPIGASLIIFSDEIVIGLMGNKWKDAIIVVKIIAIYGILAGFGGNATLFLRAIGRANITTTIQMVRAPILIVAFLYCAPKGLFAISLSHAVMIVLVIPLYLFITMRAVGIKPSEGLQIFIKPMIAFAVFILTALASKHIFSELGIFNPLISLPLSFFVYTVTILLIDIKMKIEFKEKIARIINERMG